MSRFASVSLWFSGALLFVALVFSNQRVLTLERAELEQASGWVSLEQLAGAAGSTGVSARLIEVQLRAGERALFELCARDRLEPERWSNAFEIAVFRLPKLQLMLRVPLDRAHLALVKRGPEGACLALGGGPIEQTGDYSVDAIWPARPPPRELRAVELQLRVLARAAIGAADRALVIALALCALFAVAVLAFARRGSSSDATAGRSPDPDPRTRALAGAALGVLALFAAMEVPSHGSTYTLWKGVGLVALQVGLAFALARVCLRSPPPRALALEAPANPWPSALAAVLSAVAMFAIARLAQRIVPSTGEAPIQTFIAWPSGMLCFAVLGCVLPLGEELFFRGYLYRAALPFGAGLAYAVSLIAFVALHAQQSWGNWGALLSIAAAGALLTGLRAWSGSVLVPAFAHLLYNFALSMASF